VLGGHETVQRARQCMKERRAGSVLVVDEQQRLTGIFTGRDAVRTLAEGKDADDDVGACYDASSNNDHSG
jgi:CBS domain-containing protein